MSSITTLRARSITRCTPLFMLMFLSALINFMIQAAPVSISVKKPNSDAEVSSPQNGPYNISVQGGIAGAILIVFGLFLCFFGVRFFRICLFLIGFYFLGNITYIGMANGGVTSETLLLVISIVVGIISGLILVCCSRCAVAILGGLALYVLGLWILGWKSGGVITSSAGRGVLLGVLAVVGFFIGLCCEHQTVIMGSAIVGAYSVVAGVDMFAHTGFINAADSFIHSKNNIDNRVGGPLTAGAYALLGAFIVLALLGMAVQFHMWGRRTFRSAGPATGSNVVYTEKPSRFGGFFHRRY